MKNQKIIFAVLAIVAVGTAFGLFVFISSMDFPSVSPLQNSAGATPAKKQKEAPTGKIPPRGGMGICRDLCGNGRCESMVCQGENCPCPETAASCSADCNKTER